MILSATGISVAFAGRAVLTDVAVTLAAGEVVALIGPNGSGKTTLIRALLGHLPASGTIAWDGRPLGNWSAKALARRVAYLPQTPTFGPDDRVIDVLRLGRSAYWRWFGVETETDEAIVRAVATELELSELLERPVATLSGGQRQRVFVGRCLAQGPAALLLDEPGTYLDLKHQVELNRLLKRLAREKNIAVLMASHDLNVASVFADRMILLADGLLRAAGPPGEVLEPALLESAYGVALQRVALPDGTVFVMPRMG